MVYYLCVLVLLGILSGCYLTEYHYRRIRLHRVLGVFFLLLAASIILEITCLTKL
jgi:hypothetical protein